MNTNSNSYTIIYASVMVVIVAFLLAFVSSSLKDIQNKNQELDTKKQILAALNIRDVKDAEAEYNKYVKGDMLMTVDGNLTENTDGFSISYEKEAKENKKFGKTIACAFYFYFFAFYFSGTPNDRSQSALSVFLLCDPTDFFDDLRRNRTDRITVVVG